ncbi:sugar isomerase (SIS) [Mycobacteroides abscessus subsp. abscessus]|nr:sugar isomerase (SIS) [Mycobacteroides abscessus subsp. abscessus]
MVQLKVPVQNYIENAKEVLEKEATAILALSNTLDNSFNEAVSMILECQGRIVITGIGKSGIIGRKINATLASTGTPSFFLHPSEGLHGDLGMVTNQDIVIAISNSGESDEVLKILPSLNKIGVKMIAIVSNTNSTLARKSDIVLSIGKVEEACPLGLAPTTSTTVTLALGDALAMALLNARDFQSDDFAVFHPAGSLGRKLLLTVQDVVQATQKNPLTTGDSTIKDALFLMTAQGLGAATVVDEFNKLIGILTDGDIRRSFAFSKDVLTKNVSELCNPTPIVISTETLASDAFELMEEHKVNVLPVINEFDEPVGMIHIHDLMKLGI